MPEAAPNTAPPASFEDPITASMAAAAEKGVAALTGAVYAAQLMAGRRARALEERDQQPRPGVSPPSRPGVSPPRPDEPDRVQLPPSGRRALTVERPALPPGAHTGPAGARPGQQPPPGRGGPSGQQPPGPGGPAGEDPTVAAARTAVRNLVEAGHLDQRTAGRIVSNASWWAMAHRLREVSAGLHLDPTSTLRHAVDMLGPPTGAQVRAPAAVLYARLGWLADPTRAPQGAQGLASDARNAARDEAIRRGGPVIDGQVVTPGQRPAGRDHQGRRSQKTAGGTAFSSPPRPRRPQGTRGQAPRRTTPPPQRSHGPRRG